MAMMFRGSELRREAVMLRRENLGESAIDRLGPSSVLVHTNLYLFFLLQPTMT